MIDGNGNGLIGWLQAMFGGAATTLFAAGLGRLVYHGSEVRYGRRPMFGLHLVWEVPTAIAMALVIAMLSVVKTLINIARDGLGGLGCASGGC